jgi:hypothetical protein
MPNKNNGRGKPPKSVKGTFTPPPNPPDYDALTPKFCLNFLQDGFNLHALDTEGQAAFALTLQKLASFKWKELITAPRHGCGTEHISAAQIKPKIPDKFQDQNKFLVFRYNGKLPMAGVRVEDVYHVLWIERWYGELYDHD